MAISVLFGLSEDRPVPRFSVNGKRIRRNPKRGKQKFDPAKEKARQLTYRERKRLAGICRYCSDAALPEKRYCEAHRKANVESAVAANRKNRKNRNPDAPSPDRNAN